MVLIFNSLLVPVSSLPEQPLPAVSGEPFLHSPGLHRGGRHHLPCAEPVPVPEDR